MEAKLTTFLYCLGTTNMDGNNTAINAMGILPVLTPEFIPSTYSFSIIVGIRAIDDSRDHSMNIIFMDPERHALVEARNVTIQRTQMKENMLNLPPEYRGLTIAMDMRNVVLRKEGVYSTLVEFDGQKMGEFEIYAKAKDQNM